MKKERLLIIRFSSFGDIVQTWGAVRAFKDVHPQGEVHWVTRSDFAEIVRILPELDCVWSLDRRDGIKGLWRLARTFNALGFTHVYDAHSNLRSHLLSWMVRKSDFVRRSKERWKRLLLFQFGKNLFPEPFRAQWSYLTPLRAWGIHAHPKPLTIHTPSETRLNVDTKLKTVPSFVALAPSAAWELKRWPITYWKSLIQQNPHVHFVILGGREDTFCAELVPRLAERPPTDRQQVLNLAGETTLLESIEIIARARALVSADTGTLHVADALGVPTLALIGPTAFGYPSLTSSRVLEVSLSCKPCSKDGRGRCHNREFKKCMTDVTPERATSALHDILTPEPTL